MTAEVAERAPEVTATPDEGLAKWPGAAPGCPYWATSTHYDYGDEERNVIAHCRKTCIHGEKDWAGEFDVLVEYDPETRRTDFDGINISIIGRGVSAHDGIELDRMAGLGLMRELAIVLGVRDLGPLLDPEILTCDPYRPKGDGLD